MRINDAIVKAEAGHYDGICQDSWGNRIMLVIPDSGGPLFFYDKQTKAYVEHHGHAPFWNPTAEELSAGDWQPCNMKDINMSE